MSSKTGLITAATCEGPANQKAGCDAGKCSNSADCSKLGMSMKFYGFSGRPATSVADCSWDFFGCTKKLGYWPKNKKCCQERFDTCCMVVMGKQPMVTTTTTTTTKTTTTKIPQIATTARPSHVAQKPEDRIELSK